MNVDKWIEALQHPLVLAGFGLFLFAALIKPLFLNNSKLSGTATERLLHKGMNFAFALALLAIAGGLLLSWRDNSKASATKEKNTKPDPVPISNQVMSGGGMINISNNYGLSKEQYGEILNEVLKSFAEQTRLPGAAADEGVHEKELALRRYADETLTKIQGQLPEEQLKQAKAKLEQGDTQAAERDFNAVVEKIGGIVALAAYQGGQLAEGRLDYKKALQQYKKAVGLEEDNLEYLLAAGRIAWKMGEYSQAEGWLKHLLNIREKGKDDAQLGASINNLALIYEKQGRYSEAELLYKRSLEIREKVFGKDHPDVAQNLNNLAGLYSAQGRYQEAEPLYKRSASGKKILKIILLEPDRLF
ncbi:tetratricopeptide repeat protein, partial [Desulfobulbus sp. F3]|nr:tetratricopeptide repeat protein [Desulfobulbus sp. F3]